MKSGLGRQIAIVQRALRLKVLECLHTRRELPNLPKFYQLIR